MERGFSTLELLIALTIMMMTFTAVILTTFGNQALISGGQTNAEAMNIAQEILESAQASARRDFNLVNAVPPTLDGIYTKNSTVLFQSDYLTKKVTAVLSWKDERLVQKQLQLTTLISNFENPTGADTCNSSPSGDWTLRTQKDYTVPALTGLLGAYPIKGLDAYLGKLYVAVGPTTGTSDTTLLTFTLTAGVPMYDAGSGIDTSGGTSKKGPTAVRVAKALGSPNVYAYVANSVTPTWSAPTCAAGPACSQLQVIDVTNPSTLSIIANVKVIGVTGTGGQGIGKSLFYRNGYVFLGLTKTGGGPEFIIFDVRNPASPLQIGSFPVGAGVDAIFVRGLYAYLATNDKSGGVLKILSIADPTTPTLVASLLSSSFGVGNSLAMVGDTIHFGKAFNGGGHELYTIHSPNPGITLPTTLKSIAIGASINALLIRDSLMYVLKGTNMLEIRNSKTFVPHATAVTLVGNGSAMDCEGNYVYAGTDAGGITVVTAQ